MILINLDSEVVFLQADYATVRRIADAVCTQREVRKKTERLDFDGRYWLARDCRFSRLP